MVSEDDTPREPSFAGRSLIEGNLIPLADQPGIDVAGTLEANLREEREALDELSEIGEEFDYGQIEESPYRAENSRPHRSDHQAASRSQ